MHCYLIHEEFSNLIEELRRMEASAWRETGKSGDNNAAAHIPHGYHLPERANPHRALRFVESRSELPASLVAITKFNIIAQRTRTLIINLIICVKSCCRLIIRQTVARVAAIRNA
jgi:hypothetical protein